MPRASTKALTKRLVQGTFHTFGLHVSYNKTGWDRVFAGLRGGGFAPSHIIDVGANRGGWTRLALQYFPSAFITMIEPQDGLKSYVPDLLRAGRVRWINCGAGEESGVLPLGIGESDDSSSFAHRASGKTIEVPIRTLNEIVAEGGYPLPQMVKIDAEGFDLKVLKGASKLLGCADIFFLEASFRGGWENTVENTISIMAANGYHLIDVPIINPSPRSGLAWLCDLAFMLNGSPFLDYAASYL